MVVSLEGFSRLVTAIYATVSRPELWADCMTEIGRAFDATGAGLIVAPNDHRRSLLAASIPTSARDSYQSYYCGIDHVLDALEAAPVGVIHPGSEVIDPHSETEFNVDWMRPHHMGDGIFVRLNAGPGTATFIVSAQRQNSPFCTGDRLQMATALLPHLQQSLRIQRHIAIHDSNLRDLEDTIDNVRCAVLILTRRLGIKRTNRAAEDILSDADGLTAPQRVLHAAHRTTNTMLRVSIAAISGPGCTPRPARTLACPRPSGKQPYVIHVLPTRRNDISTAEPSALVLIVDPARNLGPPHTMLRLLYGLTNAEAQVAVHVLRGDGLNPIATELGVSLATVKTHLQHVFAKSATHRQAELVRLLTQIIP